MQSKQELTNQIEKMKSQIAQLDESDFWGGMKIVELKQAISKNKADIARLDRKPASAEEIARMEYGNRVMDSIDSGEYDDY